MPRLAPSRWLGALIGAILALAVVPALRDIYELFATETIDDYVVATSVQVLDAKVGEMPLVVPNGAILKPFRGDYVVTVRRVTPDGLETLPECPPATGVVDYSPETIMRQEVPLDQWMGIHDDPSKRCDLPAGEYNMTTLVDARHIKTRRHDMRVVSNIFTMYEDDPPGGGNRERRRGSYEP